MGLLNAPAAAIENEDMRIAAKEAAKAVKEKLQGDPKLLVVFASYSYPPEQYEEALAEIQKVFSPDVPLVGGTAFSFFAENKAYDVWQSQGKLKAVGILALESEYVQAGIGIGTGVDKDAKKAGEDSIQNALEDLEYNPSAAYMAMAQRGAKDLMDLRPLNGFLLTPGATAKHLFLGNSILEGITGITKRSLRLTGGGLGGQIKEDGSFSQTYQFFRGKVYEESVISVVFGSDLEIGYGTANGFKAMNTGVFITKADGWTIHEINGKPAAQALAEVFEQEAGIPKDEFLKSPLFATVAKGYVLGASEPRGDFYWPVDPIGIAPDGGVLVNVEVQAGRALAVIQNTKSVCKEATVEAAKTMAKDINSTDFNLVLMFSCTLRGFLLQEEYSQEIAVLRQAIGEQSQVFGLGSSEEIGFYRAGNLMGTSYTNSMMGFSNKLISEV